MDETNADTKMMTMEEMAPLMRRKKKLPPVVFLLAIAITSMIGIYIMQIIPTENTTIQPENNLNESTSEPVKIILCDKDKVCDTGENNIDCAEDCIPSTALSAVRSNDSDSADTTPTVTVRMQDPNGISSCGTSTTDSTQWDCTVRNPGSVVTDVDCTLRDYVLDGRYMLMLRCKNNNGNDVTPVMMDDIVICADSLGCKR